MMKGGPRKNTGNVLTALKDLKILCICFPPQREISFRQAV